MLESARELVALELKKDINRGIPEFARLELVLAAIQARKYSFAEYFLDDLLRSKNKQAQAAAYTAAGLIAADDIKAICGERVAWLCGEATRIMGERSEGAGRRSAGVGLDALIPRSPERSEGAERPSVGGGAPTQLK